MVVEPTIPTQSVIESHSEAVDYLSPELLFASLRSPCLNTAQLNRRCDILSRSLNRGVGDPKSIVLTIQLDLCERE